MSGLRAFPSFAPLSTALGYILFFRKMVRAGATHTSQLTLLAQISGILPGTLVLGETLEPKHFASMVLITLGLVAIDGRAWRWVWGETEGWRLGGVSGSIGD